MSLFGRLMENAVALAAAPLFSPSRPAGRLRSALCDLRGRPVVGRDGAFAVEAAESIRTEAALARLVADRAEPGLVRDLALRVAGDATAAAVELETLAAGRRVTLPASPSAAAEAASAALSGLEPGEMAEAWLERLGTVHAGNLDLFRRERDGGEDRELAAFAGRWLPILEEQLRMARHLSPKNAHKTGKRLHKKH